MATAVNFEPRDNSRLHEFANLHKAWFLSLIFAVLIGAQAVGFLILGTGRAGLGVALTILIGSSLLALACAWHAFRRAQGISALFWFLFAAVLVVLLIPTGFQTYDALFGQSTLSDSTWRLLYCLYGAPVLMILFLPDTYRRARVKFEIFLDLFQVAIVVALIYSTFFFLPAQRMMPDQALLHNISISDAQSLLLLIIAMVRLQFVRLRSTRSLLLRLALFLLVCAVATFIGDWIDLHHYWNAAVWFTLGWTIPQVAAGLIALTWIPSPEPESESASEPANFVSFLGTNLVLVAMLSCVALLMNQWKQAYGEILTSAAIAASLLAFTFRLALTQFHQQQEIAQRKAAQLQLTDSHLEVGRLLADARRQTAELIQISELGSLLHACTSQEEVFRLIPERLRRLFPGASGCISLLSVSKKRVESVAKWGISTAGQVFLPDQCWAMRRGRTHADSGKGSDPRCSHLLGEGPSVCVPLIANSDAIGTLSVQDDAPPHPFPDSEADSGAFDRRRHLAATVAEHIALALANLGLRESLRLQAVRDPLTGLYNRRYMQEFLDRELHSARRKHRSLAVMMLDLDHFKRYNDNFGHGAGDRALAAFGEMLQRSVRAEDIACRYGGEEFALILPECSLLHATVRAEEISMRIREYRPQNEGQANADQKNADQKNAGQKIEDQKIERQKMDALTVSIGVAAFDETTDRVDLLLKFADDALYDAKRAGRARVVVARPGVALPELNLTEKNPVPTT
jgi:diguanylate cyclase (GGDEF)-like protein